MNYDKRVSELKDELISLGQKVTSVKEEILRLEKAKTLDTYENELFLSEVKKLVDIVMPYCSKDVKVSLDEVCKGTLKIIIASEVPWDDELVILHERLYNVFPFLVYNSSSSKRDYLHYSFYVKDLKAHFFDDVVKALQERI